MKTKIITIIFYFFLSTNAFSHSQTPTKYGGKTNKLDSISTKQIKIVPISIKNLNAYAQAYEIYINNIKVGKTNKLIKNQELKVDVPVKIKEANKLLRYDICTLSISNTKSEMFRTKICTKSYLFWVKN